ncbi:FAD-binding domain-containing protein [Lentinus tigrinus ALCF2SS1-7]|uniref:FAD-binding domain-containing protein n=1 Tax=Lentinus tigrinus ALCF2SS1-6 TaxID=1328759 RepID=A0A5C2RUE9_9APHY|nr:FAD-binding domain-containing protein [Lentinus tigrinus ALCF2SS1-6]RPD69903.1 FAD-binding domain-containing protein [Lentinus tigrinus ALCF2SS1-7]
MKSSLYLLPGFVLAVLGATIQYVPPDQWDALNSTVGGHLHVAAPFSRACFPEAVTGVPGTFDESACTQVQQNYNDPASRSNSFGAYMNTQWETCEATSEQCLLNFLNTSDPSAFTPPQVCAQGGVPPYYIDIHGPGDVQAAFNFSKSTGVPLAIKNSGHDYSGRSSAPNSLGLWTHNLQQISYDSAFVPAGCPDSKSSSGVTFGAGVTLDALYDFADANNLTIPGGVAPTVAAAGGFLQGGGHGIFSNAFGLAADRALQFKVVTPSGTYLTATACQNSDLFFALRGGGGGTFGVVLEVTTRPLPQLAFPVVAVTLGDVNATQLSEWLRFLVANAIPYAETGWGGYIGYTTGAIFANPLINETQAASEMASLKDFLAILPNATFSLSTQPSFLTFFDTFAAILDAVPVGLPLSASSRLIPADNFRTPEKQAELATTLETVLQVSISPFIFAVAPYLFEDDGMTSVTPAWRGAIWHVPISAAWNFDTTKEEKKAILTGLSAAMDLLRAITPGSGAYQNEADVHEPNYTDSFWGANYDKLVEIKRMYDPDHLLDCWNCVDSQGPTSERFACYI